jgi:hypothetical protein
MGEYKEISEIYVEQLGSGRYKAIVMATLAIGLETSCLVTVYAICTSVTEHIRLLQRA